MTTNQEQLKSLGSKLEDVRDHLDVLKAELGKIEHDLDSALDELAKVTINETKPPKKPPPGMLF